MICKWCGETVKAGSRTCRRCKRDIPALSDCGGFYDLVAAEVPASAPIPQPTPVMEAPVHPVLPEPKKNSPLLGLICGVAAVLAVVFLIMTISLSGQLADAREEADRLRNQNNSKGDTVETDPSVPNINGLGDKNPKPTDEPDKIHVLLESGVGEIQLNAAQIAQLNDGILHFSVCRDGESDAVLTFTLQRQSAEEDGDVLFLQITQTNGSVIHSIEWHNEELVDVPEDEDHGSIFDYIFTSTDAITEYSKPIDELGEGKSICTLSGEDESGEELIITVANIVID